MATLTERRGPRCVTTVTTNRNTLLKHLVTLPDKCIPIVCVTEYCSGPPSCYLPPPFHRPLFPDVIQIRALYEPLVMPVIY